MNIIDFRIYLNNEYENNGGKIFGILVLTVVAFLWWYYL